MSSEDISKSSESQVWIKVKPGERSQVLRFIAVFRAIEKLSDHTRLPRVVLISVQFLCAHFLSFSAVPSSVQIEILTKVVRRRDTIKILFFLLTNKQPK